MIGLRWYRKKKIQKIRRGNASLACSRAPVKDKKKKKKKTGVPALGLGGDARLEVLG